MIKRYGLVGRGIGHSFSPRYFGDKFRREGIQDSRYELFDMGDIGELHALLQTKDLEGFNVTIPYKRAILPLLDGVSEEARAVGAVNTVRLRGGKTMGYNTDVYGFGLSLRRALDEADGRGRGGGALVLGTGGASLAVQYCLQQMGRPYRLVSRHPQAGQYSYEAVNEAVISAHTLIINTTPLGMYPRADTCPPLPYTALQPLHLLFDLVYNPEETLFMQRGKEQGAYTKNGAEMLSLQAEKAWEIWNRL